MEGLRYFQHCHRDVNIICFNVPRQCPICGQDTYNTESRIPPFILPSPFCASTDVKCGVVIKPTRGDYVSHYTSEADLHIGVTNSTGCLYDFDEDGIHCGNIWSQCVKIDLPDGISGDGYLWDQQLHRFAQTWASKRYQEEENNCFDFVLRFLQSLNLHHFVSCLSSKSNLASSLVAPSNNKAARFVLLYREVKKMGFVCQHVS